MGIEEPILREANEAEREEKLKKEAEEAEDDAVIDVPFTKQMREATKQVHNLSDAMVNAKLGIAMTEDRVWAEGLLVFYEVFKFLEEAVQRLKGRNEYFARFEKVLDGINRKEAFEADLQYYYGENWRKTCYVVRPSLANYLKHLKILEEREPLRLLAYIYHMYMGLLSGGQIIKKKRELKSRLSSGTSSFLSFIVPACVLGKACGIDSQKPKSTLLGCAATDFSNIEGRTISSMKKDIAFTMNDIAEDLSKDERKSLMDESIKVFEWNNQVVSTIEVSWFSAISNIATNPFVASFLLAFLGFMWYLLFLRWVDD